MRYPSFKFSRLILFCFSVLLSGNSDAQQMDSTLEKGFQTPPFSAKPRTWWHWTRGNISMEGITKDLEWMDRVGIGGFQIADVNFGTGQEVEEKILFGSSEWLDAVNHASKEAERLDLEMAVFSSAGWSLAGGPWVKPGQAMKKLVWNETFVEGPKTFSEKIDSPPTVNGPIRNMSRSSQPNEDPEFYGDFAVIAYPTSVYKHDLDDIEPEVTLNGKIIDSKALLDDDLNSFLSAPVDDLSGKIIIEFTYPEPVTIRAASIASREGIPIGQLSASMDQEKYVTLTALPGPQLYRPGKVRTYSFPKQKAKYFRLEITNAPPSPAQVMHQHPPETLSDTLNLTEFKLHSGARVHRWEDKAGFSFLFDYSSVNSPEFAESNAIDPEKIIDLTGKLDKDGNLNWEVPEGNWTILRAGYSLTGAKNRPAVPAGLGYEVDKLSREHTLAYIQNYIEPIKDKLGLLFGERLQYVMMDSWEAGMQNWTEKMGEEFHKRRGYSLLPYLPVLTGQVVENAEMSDRFLWDFRRTLADMFAENFYAVMTEYLNEIGLKTYSEASGVSLEILEDALLCKKYVDIPMGEFWVRDLHPSAMYHVDVRGAASAAHAYGKPLVAAEAFTGGGFESPQTLKNVSDYWFTQGVNRIVFHTSTHQPLDTKPGNAMVGAHLHRNITWAEQAAPFMTYIARNSFMLQKGKFVADIAYLLKEGAPSTMPFWGDGPEPSPPDGYDYDYVNTDILINRMSVDNNGRIVLPDGMSYQLLVLPQSSTMTLKTLKKIYSLVNKGATIFGPKPRTTPGLESYPDAVEEFHQLANDLWKDLDGISRTKGYVGKGRIFWGERLNDVLKEMKIDKDVDHSRGLNTNISWIHRRQNDTDIYFISNQSDTAENINFSFRLSGKQPGLWYADDGSMEEASYMMGETRTMVPIHLDPYEAVFVVFRKDTNEKEKQVAGYRESTITEITGPWTLHFPEGWEASESAKYQELQSWTKSSETGIKYFSGTASYLNSVKISKKTLKENATIWLDLGKVKDLAQVYINGTKAELLWKEPYKVDISKLIQSDENEIRIDVTNQWTNRLAGDQNLTDDARILDSFIPRFRSPWEVEESGLMGPIKIIIQSPETENEKP